MNTDVLDVRRTYEYLRKSNTHLVQSSEIATACVCQNLFKLDYPYGAITSDRDYLIANTVHDIMSLCMVGPILENWQTRPNEHESLTRRIISDSQEMVKVIIEDVQEIASKENRIVPHDFHDRVNETYHGLIEGITRRLMQRYEKPVKVITEVTISNIKNHHEGRIDALLEYSNGYGLLDWKSYDLSKTVSGREKWQLIANALLANYRYCLDEDDWSRYRFSCIVHYTGAYFPRMETVEKEVEKIRVNRKFAHDVLCGVRVHAQRPRFCPVCDKGLEGSKECQFYQLDSKLFHEGMLPAQYDKLTRQFFAKRYAILKERAETHLHKHVAAVLIDRYGEEQAIRRLEKTGIICRGFTYDFDVDEKVILSGTDDNIPLEPRKIVRIIGKEEDMPLLSSVSEQASVVEVGDNKIALSFRSKIAVRRAKRQLFHLPIIMLRDELNLTRSMLRPIHTFHKLAADIFIPQELLPK